MGDQMAESGVDVSIERKDEPAPADGKRHPNTCPSCGSHYRDEELRAALRVCSQCGHHFPMPARERIDYLRQHPDLKLLEADILTLAAQMSQQSHRLAEIYNDERVTRAKDFLQQRQREAEDQRPGDLPGHRAGPLERAEQLVPGGSE